MALAPSSKQNGLHPQEWMSTLMLPAYMAGELTGQAGGHKHNGQQSILTTTLHGGIICNHCSIQHIESSLGMQKNTNSLQQSFCM